MESSEPRSPDSLNQGAAALLVVDVIHRSTAWGEHVGDGVLVQAARAAYDATGHTEAAEVSLLLSDDAEIRRLNATWRGKDEATNVLSFPLDTPPVDAGARHLGDIALARETILREAAAKGVSAGQHAAHLVVHGLLHLLGYDHGDTHEAEKMEALEVRILTKIGVPDPYVAEALSEGDIK